MQKLCESCLDRVECTWQTCEHYRKEVKMKDQINPDHYKDYPVEVIDIIKQVLTPEQYEGFLLGNEIKYRLRAGLKNR